MSKFNANVNATEITNVQNNLVTSGKDYRKYLNQAVIDALFAANVNKNATVMKDLQNKLADANPSDLKLVDIVIKRMSICTLDDKKTDVASNKRYNYFPVTGIITDKTKQAVIDSKIATFNEFMEKGNIVVKNSKGESETINAVDIITLAEKVLKDAPAAPKAIEVDKKVKSFMSAFDGGTGKDKNGTVIVAFDVVSQMLNQIQSGGMISSQYFTEDQKESLKARIDEIFTAQQAIIAKMNVSKSL